MTAPKWYDFTWSREKLKERGLDGYEKVAQLLENLGADRYCIGEEVGDDGYQHFQIRVVFKSEKDWDHLKATFGCFGHVSPTSAECRNFRYCEKQGKYYRSWEKVLRKFIDLKLYDWQQSAVEELSKQNDREIMVIVDPEGNNGKSWLTKHLVATHVCNIVPVLGDYKDMMRICMAKAGTGYIIDMERTQDPKKAHGLWRAIESVKNGYLFEDRYNFRDMWIEPPKVLVLTNDMPPLEALSRDRWRIYTIYDQYGVQWLEEIANE